MDKIRFHKHSIPPSISMEPLSVVLGLGAFVSFAEAWQNYNVNCKERAELQRDLLRYATPHIVKTRAFNYIYDCKLKKSDAFALLRIYDLVPVVKTREVLRIGNWFSFTEHYKSSEPHRVFSDHVTTIPNIRLALKHDVWKNYSTRKTKLVKEEALKYVQDTYKQDVSFRTFRGKKLVVEEMRPASNIAFYGFNNTNNEFVAIAVGDNEIQLASEIADLHPGSKYVSPF